MQFNNNNKTEYYIYNKEKQLIATKIQIGG